MTIGTLSVADYTNNTFGIAKGEAGLGLRDRSRYVSNV